MGKFPKGVSVFSLFRIINKNGSPIFTSSETVFRGLHNQTCLRVLEITLKITLCQFIFPNTEFELTNMTMLTLHYTSFMLITILQTKKGRPTWELFGSCGRGLVRSPLVWNKGIFALELRE